MPVSAPPSLRESELHLPTSRIRVKYKYKFSPSVNLDSIGGLERNSLSLENASSHSSVQSRPLLFFIVVKNGLHLLVDRDRKLLRVVACPVRLCISFLVLGYLIYMVALIKSRLASIPRLVTILPKNFPNDTPKVHWVLLHVVLLEHIK